MAVAYQNPYTPKVRFEWIGESWQLFAAQAGTWIISIILFYAIFAAIGFACLFGFGLPGELNSIRLTSYGMNTYRNVFPLFALPAYWATLVIMTFTITYLYAGLVRMAIAQVRGDEIRPAMMFQAGSIFWPFLLYSIVFEVLTTIGGYLCFFPAFIVAGIFLPGLALIANGETFSSAFNRSVTVMSKDWLMAGVFVFIYTLIGILSVIPCGLGIFVTYPMGFIILALVYRDMFGLPGGSMQADPINPYAPAPPGVWPPPPMSTAPPAAPQWPAQAPEPRSEDIPSAEPPIEPGTGGPADSV